MLRRVIIVLAGLASVSLVSAFVQKTTRDGVERSWNFENPHRQIPDTVFNRQTQSILFHLAEDAFSEANREAELNAVRASFGQWMAIPETHVAFEEGPLVGADVDINTRDGTNVVFWAKSSTLVNGETSDIGGRNGVAFVSFFLSGEIAAADIVLNGVDRDWFADQRNPEEGKFSIETVAIHEIGHLLGMAHTVIPSAIMFPRGGSALGTRSGLTPDEAAFARSQYGVTGLSDTLGVVEGRVTNSDGEGVLGAGVLLEDPSGGIIASTMSLDPVGEQPLGQYRFPAVTPGDYQLRVFPLAPADLNTGFVKAREIDGLRFSPAEVNFTPSEGVPVTVSAGQAVTQDFEITIAEPAFRFDRFLVPSEDPRQIRSNTIPVVLSPGSPLGRLGVFGEDLPVEDVNLIITGDGLELGPVETTTDFFNGLPHIFREVTVTEDATPGARSFIVERGSDRAIAAGYFLVRSNDRDDNFDGLDDAFQREHFTVFTDPEAAPDADPDRDGITNREEAQQGTNPNISDRETPLVDPFEIDRVAVTGQGVVVTLATSVDGALYQLYARDRVEDGDWQSVGDAVLGSGAALDLMDAEARAIRFYEVRTVE